MKMIVLPSKNHLPLSSRYLIFLDNYKSYLFLQGFFCPNTTVTPEICPKGHYCMNGTKYGTQYKCHPGTFNNKTGQQNISSCLLCPPGKYCEGFGRTEPNRDCDPGFFCRGGANSARPGDIGVLSLNATSAGATCYKPYDCICPAFNSTTGELLSLFLKIHKCRCPSLTRERRLYRSCLELLEFIHFC